jgi:hypothetical protein
MKKLYVLLTMIIWGGLITISHELSANNLLAPNPVCQTTTVLLDDQGTATLPPEWVDGGSSAPNGPITLQVTPAEFSCADLGVVPVTLIVTDQDGITASCETEITVSDMIAPEISCTSATITLSSGECTTDISHLVEANDNCEFIEIDQVSGPVDLLWTDPIPIGVHEFTLQATDGSDQTATCQFTVTVLEYPNPIPSLTCNNWVQVSLGPDGLAALLADDFLEGGPYGCFDNYQVEVLNEFGNSLGSVVDCSFIGTTWTAVVNDPNNGNQCWSSLVVEDKIAPIFICPTDPVSLNCTESINDLPNPLAADNCTEIIYELAEQSQTDSDICDDGLVIWTQQWIATDAYGNTSSPCVRTIEVTRPASIDFPDDQNWSCDAYATFPNVIEPILFTGDPSTSGSGIPNEGAINAPACSYQYTHADEVLSGCGSTFDIIRTWTILDWCTNTIIVSNDDGEDNVQYIYVLDETPPTLELPATWTVSAEELGNYPNPCFSLGDLPPPLSVTDCSETTVRIFTTVGEAIYSNGENGAEGGTIPTPGLPYGSHEVLYVAEDACGNTTQEILSIEVIDDIAPTTICDEITEVVLSSDGLAVVSADVFDDGSYDNCCLETLEVRRMNGACDGSPTVFAAEVTFCCEDVGGDPVVVVFRARDCHDNVNDCMVQVEVQDKQAPQLLFCPPNQTIDCNTYLEQYAAGVEQEDYSVLIPLGMPSFQDNCDLTLDETVTSSIDNCTDGQLIRTWSASDPANNTSATCTQTIQVNHVSDWVVEFPQNIDFDCLDIKIGDFGEPEVFFDECELIATSFEETVFTVVPDACFKIERHWVVINWCIYDEFGEDLYPEVGFAECDLGIDLDGDGDMDCRTFQDGLNAAQTPDGYIQFQQVIKLIDNKPPDVVIPELDGCILDADCRLDLLLPYPEIFDACSEEFRVDISSIEFGDFDDIPLEGILLTDVVAGTYSFTYSTTDECGNTDYQTVEVIVEDCKKPTPVCEEIVAELMPTTNLVEVPAVTFDAGSFDNCSGPLIFSFSADTTNTVEVFNCQNLSQNTVTIWVTDQNGNQAFCETTIIIQDNQNACVFAPIIAGTIASEFMGYLEGASLEVNGLPSGVLSDEWGEYSLEVEAGLDYTIAPYLDEDPLSGVSTYDLVLISRHILGVDPLQSPYQIIAADVNRSGSVTTLDMVILQKLILQLIVDIPNNTSYRFVDAAYEFPIPDQPFQSSFPEFVNLNNLWASQDLVDFVAIKVGDVNGNAFYADQEAGNRGLPAQLFAEQMSSGEHELHIEAPTPILGGQFALNLPNGSRFVPANWLSTQQYVVDGQQVRVSFTFETPHAPTLSIGSVVLDREQDKLDMQLHSHLLSPEVYGEGLTIHPLQGMELRPEATGFHATPNPFQGQFDLAWEQITAGQVQLEVVDVAGQIIWQGTREAFVGQQKWTIELPGTQGLVLVRIFDENKNQLFSQRMVAF